MSHNISGMAPFVGMSRVRNPNMYYPCQGGDGQQPMPPMQMQQMRSPFFMDERMEKPMHPCGWYAWKCFSMPMQHEFKSPPVGPSMPESPGVAKKKRRTSTATSAPPPQVSPIIDMMPPPPTGYGDTIVASNPFDDSPQQLGPPMGMGHSHMGHHQSHHMNHHHHHQHHPHMSGGVNHMGGMNHMGGNMGSMNMSGPPMPPQPMNMPGPPTNNINPMNQMGGMSPMAGSPMGNSPMSSPMGNMSNIGNMGNMSNVGNMGGGMPPNSMHMNMHHSTVHHPFGSPGMGPKPMPVSTGKIYPPDQPMVFNPQNPNAPPIYPCGICHKEVHDNDQAILCESGCNFWFHRICTGLTEAAYTMLTAEVYAEWVCDKCLSAKSIPLVKFKP
ncbi:hypothetical protein B566_EDAN015646 [Ephemera danica]|nr:hypothetical protein B566_EDAN015646 [Ephemera danica]